MFILTHHHGLSPVVHVSTYFIFNTGGYIILNYIILYYIILYLLYDMILYYIINVDACIDLRERLRQIVVIIITNNSTCSVII